MLPQQVSCPQLEGSFSPPQCWSRRLPLPLSVIPKHALVSPSIPFWLRFYHFIPVLESTVSCSITPAMGFISGACKVLVLV